jgi:quinol monooxygenase YgiN
MDQAGRGVYGLSRASHHGIGGRKVIVIRCKVQVQAEKAEQLREAFQHVIAPSRAVRGVVSFDIARDLSEPNTFIATEVFEDQAARDRQESLPEVGKVMALLPESLAAPPEATAFNVSSSEPAM